MVALVAAAMPQPGLAPDVPGTWGVASRHATQWEQVTLPPVAQAPVVRKRVVRGRPARMIDDAVRRRAIEAVERAIAAEAEASS
jgi:hypothetical protein